MKKKTFHTIIMAIKYTLYCWLILTSTGVAVIANSVSAQVRSVKEVIINLEAENSRLDTILSEIERKTDYLFFYTDKSLKNKIEITLSVPSATVADYLLEISKQANIEFKQVNNSISVRQSNSEQEARKIEIIVDKYQTSVSGKITDENGEGLPGASVVEKGTSNGTITDIDGNYYLTVSEGGTLVFSFVGYHKEEMVVGNSTKIDMMLVPDIAQLSEVVVVGYGTQKQREVSGTISTVSAEQIAKTPTPSFEQALQGVTPGVQVTSSDGSPEGASRILIRGTNSVTAGTEPLIILDGNPVSYGGTSFLSQLNPNDIKSLTVLRDASAAAIYGSRGSNGVILITTKTGKNGQSELNFNFETGYSQPLDNVKPARPDEWKQALTEAYKNRFGDGLTDEQIAGELANQVANNLFNPYDTQRYLDEDIFNVTENYWYDDVISNGSYQQYGISGSKGTENASFYISGQYRRQDGSFIGEHYDRYQLRTNLDFNPTDYLKMGIKYNISLQEIDLRNKGNRTFQNSSDGRLNEGAFSDFSELYGGSLPVFPVYWPGTSEPFDPYSGFNLIYSNSGNTSTTSQVLNNVGNIYLNFEPVENFQINGDVGINYNVVDDKRWASDRARYYGVTQLGELNVPLDSAIRYTGQNRINESRREFLSLNYTGTATYSSTFLKAHNVSVLVGVEVLDTYLSRSNFSVQGYPVFFNEQEDVYTRITQEDAADKLLILDNIKGANERLFSRFARLNYDYKGKYLLQLVVRRDGSSKFSPRSRYSNFPSVSAGWIVSDESFFNFEPINFLKLKSSWGKTGNNAIGSFLFFNQYQTWPQYGNEQAYLLTNLGSGRIQWETSTTFDLGLDFGMMRNRITGSFNYFNTKTRDMLLDVRLAPSLGVYDDNPFATSNVGSIKNMGLEFELNTVNVKTKDFQWSSSLNLTTIKNEVLKLSEGKFDQVPSRYAGSNYTAVLPNVPIGTFFLPEFAGYDEEGFPLIKVIDKALAESSYQYVVLQNEMGMDSVTRATNNAVNENRILQKDKTGLPTLYGGLNNTFSYKNLSLSILMTFQAGNYIYDGVGGVYADGVGSWFREGVTDMTWSPDNKDAEFRRLYFGPNDENGDPISDVTTRNLFKGDFLRLRNISVSYDLPSSWMEKSPLQGVRFYVNMSNVATFSRFDRFDPEVLSVGGTTDRNTTQGFVGNVPYFQFFTVSGGLNVKF